MDVVVNLIPKFGVINIDMRSLNFHLLLGCAQRAVLASQTGEHDLMARIGQSATEAFETAASHLQVAAIYHAHSGTQRDSLCAKWRRKSSSSDDDPLGKTEAACVDADR